MWIAYCTLSEKVWPWIVMARFSRRPSGDIHAYTSPMSAWGLATVAGESKWSEACAIAAKPAKRTPATRTLILNTTVAFAVHALITFADMFTPSFECPLDHRRDDNRGAQAVGRRISRSALGCLGCVITECRTQKNLTPPNRGISSDDPTKRA